MSSVPRRSPPPSDEPEFFTDRGLGKRVVEALRAEGWIIHAMGEVYPSSERSRAKRFTDEEWIPTVTRRGWVILSKDGFRYSHERLAIADSGARVFMIPNASIRSEYMVERFAASREAIIELCKRPGPFLYAVHPTSLQRIRLPDTA
jgi:hypothetical protein